MIGERTAMKDCIIVINAGSSSLKFSVYAVDDSRLNLLARGQVEGLGSSPRFKAEDPAGQPMQAAQPKGDAKKFGHPEAFSHVGQWVRDQFGQHYSPAGIGHRI